MTSPTASGGSYGSEAARSVAVALLVCPGSAALDPDAVASQADSSAHTAAKTVAHFPGGQEMGSCAAPSRSDRR